MRRVGAHSKAGLHPRIIPRIIELFQDPRTNPENAQLIFSTHDATLLGTGFGEPILNRDEVWFVEKQQDGASELYPLTSFKPRKEHNLERHYLGGSYGGVPDIQPESLVEIVAAASKTELGLCPGTGPAPTAGGSGKRRDKILVVIDAEETERQYLEQFRGKSSPTIPHVKIITKNKDPLTVVNHAIRLFDSGDFDEAWCVFDEDDYKDGGTFQQAIATAGKLIRLAVSCPCFALWLLLHFEECGSELNQRTRAPPPPKAPPRLRQERAALRGLPPAPGECDQASQAARSGATEMPPEPVDRLDTRRACGA